jgi:phosphatidate phosphatase APP1
MIFVVFTRAGLDELKTNFGRIPSPLWANADVLSEAEMKQLRNSGTEVTRFAGYVDPDALSEIEDAVRTVKEHHATERIWVEHGGASDKSLEAGLAAPPEPMDEARGWKRKLQALAARADDRFDDARRRLREMGSPDVRLTIVPYLGYGTSQKLLLNGRVLRDKGFATPTQMDSAWQNLVELYKRLDSDEVPGARVRARFQNMEKEAVADREGYFRVEIEPSQPLDLPGWHAVELALVEPPPPAGTPVVAQAKVLLPPATARFGIISDIDDTVVWTNVTNKLKMLLMLTRTNAHTRKPFKGVAAFYRALCRGAGGNEANPIFYVSSSPWNLYTQLVEFMRVQGIPTGPLFLKDFGEHTLFSSRDHHTHKLASIEQILHSFPHLQFILIGDSGEQDPEIYSRVVKMYPRRIRVIYIRNVNPDPSRIEALDRLIEEVRQTGAQLVLTPDSEFAAAHAAAEGLMASSALAAVRSDKREDEGASEAQEIGSGGT